MPRGPRTTIAPWIYQDNYGIATIVKVPGHKPTEERFPAGTAVDTIVQWRAEAIRQLQDAQPVAVRGTLADGMRRYLASVTSMPSYKARRADAEAWLPLFGQRDPFSISSSELRTQLNRWADEGVAASTLNHRRQALKAVYEFLDPDRPSPVDSTQPRQAPALEARALPWDDVLELDAAFPDNKSGVMLRVVTHTGYPPARVARLTPTDVDWETAAVFLVGRRKGQGTKSERARVSVDGLAALRAYFRFFPKGGAVAKTSWIVAFHKAVATVNRQRALSGRAPLPEGLRPYDLRHSFGTKLYEETGDLFAVARTLGCSMETAQRYTLGAVPAQVDKAIAAMNAANIRHAPRPREVTVGTPGVPTAETGWHSKFASNSVLTSQPPADGVPTTRPVGTGRLSRKLAKTGANSQSQKRVPTAPLGRLVPRKQPKTECFS